VVLIGSTTGISGLLKPVGLILMLVVVVSIAFIDQPVSNLHSALLVSILGAVYLGAVPTALAFSAWACALSKMPPSELGVVTLVAPTLVVGSARAICREVPLVLVFTGGLVCQVEVALSRQRVSASPGNLQE